MIALTSLSPSHLNKEMQQTAINSWIALGLKPISLNHPSEISKLDFEGIEIVETKGTMEHKFGKPLVNINTFIDYAKSIGEKRICIINSDIILVDNYGIMDVVKERIDTSLIVSKRRDFLEDINLNKEFTPGNDVFFFNTDLDFYKNYVYTIGVCWWDYALPYAAFQANIPTYLINRPFAFHKLHNTQYRIEDWRSVSEYFTRDFGLKVTLKPEQVNKIAMTKMTETFKPLI